MVMISNFRDQAKVSLLLPWIPKFEYHRISAVILHRQRAFVKPERRMPGSVVTRYVRAAS